MEFLGYALVAIVVLYLVTRSRPRESGASDETRQPSPAGRRTQSAGPDPMQYLREQWTRAERERAAGNVSDFPHWFFDPVTDKQLRRLKENGTTLPRGSLTKGQASDLIGLSEDPDDEDKEILKFFKVPMRSLNQTTARYEVRKLFADPEKKAAWDARPAELMQKEFLKHFGADIPKGLTKLEAQKIIAGLRTRGTKDDAALEAKLAEWDAFEDIVEQLWDPEEREFFDIKKPTLAAIRAAIDALKAQGQTIEQFGGDAEKVADKLLEMNPQLRKA